MVAAATVAVLETPHRYGEPAAQLAWIAAHLPEADLVVLPEAALTGYVSTRGNFDLTSLAEHAGGESELALRALAKSRERALLVPLIERAGGRCYNSALFIDSNGEVLARYRKRHPWFPERWATPGDNPLPLINWRGLVLTVAICFDINFILEESAAELSRADVLLFPSCWVEEEDSRPQLLPEIARRSGCMVVNANWGIGSPVVPGQGDSMIISASGARLTGGATALAARDLFQEPR